MDATWRGMVSKLLVKSLEFGNQCGRDQGAEAARWAAAFNSIATAIGPHNMNEVLDERAVFDAQER